MAIRGSSFLVLVSVTILVFSAAILLKVACETPEIIDHFVFHKNCSSEYDASPATDARPGQVSFHSRLNVITRDSMISYLEKQKNSPPPVSLNDAA